MGIIVVTCCDMSSIVARCCITSFLVSTAQHPQDELHDVLYAHSVTHWLPAPSRLVFLLREVIDYCRTQIVQGIREP